MVIMACEYELKFARMLFTHLRPHTVNRVMWKLKLKTVALKWFECGFVFVYNKINLIFNAFFLFPFTVAVNEIERETEKK